MYAFIFYSIAAVAEYLVRSSQIVVLGQNPYHDAVMLYVAEGISFLFGTASFIFSIWYINAIWKGEKPYALVLPKFPIAWLIISAAVLNISSSISLSAIFPDFQWKMIWLLLACVPVLGIYFSMKYWHDAPLRALLGGVLLMVPIEFLIVVYLLSVPYRLLFSFT